MNQFFESCFHGDLELFAEIYNDQEDFFECDKKGWNALMFCAYNNRTKRMNGNRYTILKLLLEENCSKPGFKEFLNKQDKNGLTTLMMASTETTTWGVMAVDLLLKYGADKTIKDKNKWTALMVAGSCGNIEIIKSLQRIEHQRLGSEKSNCYFFDGKTLEKGKLWEN